MGNAVPGMGMILTGVERILVIVQHTPMFNHINGKLSPTPFKRYG